MRRKEGTTSVAVGSKRCDRAVAPKGKGGTLGSLCVFVCMHACVCLYACVCVRVCACVCMHKLCTLGSMCVCVRVFVCTSYAHWAACACVCLCVCVCVSACVVSLS